MLEIEREIPKTNQQPDTQKINGPVRIYGKLFALVDPFELKRHHFCA